MQRKQLFCSRLELLLNNHPHSVKITIQGLNSETCWELADYRLIKKNNKSETTTRLLATESKVLLTVWLETAEWYPVSYTAQTDTLGVGGLVIGRNKRQVILYIFFLSSFYLFPALRSWQVNPRVLDQVVSSKRLAKSPKWSVGGADWKGQILERGSQWLTKVAVVEQ